jgi:hemin uptake protein HemP
MSVDDSNARRATAAPSRADPEPDPVPRCLDTRELFGRARELRLVHAGKEYRLRITRNNKLILNR